MTPRLSSCAYALATVLRLTRSSSASGRIEGSGSPYRKDVRLKLLAEDIDQAVTQAHHLQVGKADFLRLAEERFDRFDQQRGADRRHEVS